MKTIRNFVIVLLLVMVAAACLLLPASGSDTQIDLLTVDDACLPTGAFSSANLAGALSSDSLTLSLSFALSNDYLTMKAEDYLDYLESLGTDLSSQAAIDAACLAAGDANLPPITITFDCVLDGDAISVPGALIASHSIVADSGETIGTYIVTQGTGADSNLLTISCTLSKIIYANRYDVSALSSLELDLDSSAGTDPTLTLEEVEGQIAVHVEFVTSGGGEEAGNVDYSIAKSAAARENDDPSIVYTITAAAAPSADAPVGTEARVNGLTISDAIPDGLVLTGVEYGGTLLTEGTDYTYSGGVLTYTLPAYDGTNALTSAAITVYTDLSAEKYETFIHSTSSVSWSYVNSASLYGSDPTSPLAQSSQVTSTFSGVFMQKKGELVGVNGGRFKWTVDAETYFTDGDSVYLVDTLDNIDTIHMYETDVSGNIHFTVNGVERTASAVASGGMTYTSVTTTALDTLTVNGTNAVYFTYDTGSDGTPDKAVLVIPLADADIGQPLTVVYYTQLTDILSYLSSSDSKTLKNAAKLVWDAATYTPGGSSGGGTPGTPGEDGTVIEDYSFGITKNVQAVYSMLQKSGGTYTPTSREMVWNLTVNRSGQDLTDAVITDTMDDGIQTFKSLSYQVQDASGTGSSVSIPAYTSGASAPYYILTPNADHTTTLEIHLGDINASDIYKLALKTTVVSPAILSKQSTSITPQISNTATIDAKIGGTEYSRTATASKTLSNTLILKDSTGSYNYTDHTLPWRITANQNFVPIDGAVITDTLPEGTTLGTISSVTRTTMGGTSSTGTVSAGGTGTITFSDGLVITVATTPGTSTSGYSKDTVTFTFSEETSDKFVFNFSTTVDTDFRDDMFTDLTSHTFVNNSVLTGVIHDPSGAGGADTAISVGDDASVAVTVPPVTKNGVYYDNTVYGSLGQVDYIRWTIVLNRDGVDMTGVEVLDTLPDFLELVPESLTIKAATVNSSGTPTIFGSAITEGLSLSYSGFTFAIPEAYARSPLVITFDTMVTGTADASAMRNTVSVRWADGSSTNGESGQASGAVSFDAESYGTITTAPMLQISKTSVNTAYSSGGSALYKLGGAEFTLTPLTQDGSGSWVESTSTLAKIKVTSDATGYANFFFLRRDVLYSLTETSAPVGYEPDDTVYYVVFTSGGDTSSYPSGTVVVTGSHEQLTIENEPENAHTGYSLRFTKATDTGAPLPGVSFTLEDNSSRLENQTAVSDENGIVTFANLDPGTYTLTETTPAGFVTASTATVTVSLTGGVYTVQMTGGGVSMTADGIILTNTYIRGTVSLHKTDAATGQPLSGAVFSVYDAETGELVAYLTESATTSGLYSLSSTDGTGSNALLDPAVNELGDALLSLQSGVLKLLAGDYYVTETVTPTGYLPDTDAAGALLQHSFSITSNGQAVVVTNQTEGTDFENQPCGTITGLKVTDSGEPLAGALLGLFPQGTTEFTWENLYNGMTAPSGADGFFTFTQVPYGTYVIAELEAPAGYYRNTETAYTVTVDQNTAAITADAEETNIIIQNTLITGTLTITKTSEDGVLEGFVFTVSNDSGYSEDFTTDSTGVITVNDLPVGTYTVTEKETSLTLGHYVLPDSQTVTLTADGATLTFRNKLVTASLTITKTSEDGTLGGFVFTVSNSGSGYSQDFVTDNTGKITIINLPIGTYTVTEKGTSLTQGRYVLPDSQTVALTADGAALTFHNKLVTASLTITKTSGDGALQGFVFTVSNSDSGYSQDFTTDSTGKIVVTNLPVGTYTVTEKETSLTRDRYTLPDSQTVTLTAEGAQLSFFNKLIVNPGTGEEPWVQTAKLLLAVSLAGLVLCSALLWRARASKYTSRYHRR